VKVSLNGHGHHDAEDVSAGIDTLSDVNLAHRELLSDVHPIEPDLVHGTGCPVAVPVLVSPRGDPPIGCPLLLGMPAIKMLGIEPDHHAKKQHQPFSAASAKRLYENGGTSTKARASTRSLSTSKPSPSTPP
jgi:hypothetical protein